MVTLINLNHVIFYLKTALMNIRSMIAEMIGTLLLVCTVVGSGIMAEQLAGGNVAVALLGNTIATGAILFVLITIFGPLSGAHFNPAVTMVMFLYKEITAQHATIFILSQIFGGILGTWLAHFMFELDIWQISHNARSGLSQYGSEIVATFGLVLTILLGRKLKPDAVAMLVGLYITSAYWFTASTSFANPAVTIARSISNSFAGIAPADMPFFIIAQLIGALIAMWLGAYLLRK